MAKKKTEGATVATAATPPKMDFIKLDLIDLNPNNPRKSINQKALDELTESVRVNGVLQPVLLRPKGERYELVCGERRYRASVVVKGAIKTRDNIPAVIRELTDDEALELAITENLQRKDVEPMEEADAFKQLQERRGESIKDIASRVGKSERYVALRIKLNDLIEQWKAIFVKGRINLTTAQELCKLPAEAQTILYKDKLNINENEEGFDPDDEEEDEEEDNSLIGFSNWDFKKVVGDLANADFDLKAKTLVPNMGACVNCQHNTKSNTVLFAEDEEGKGRCLLLTCFEEKTKAGYHKILEKYAGSIKYIMVDFGYSVPEWKQEAIKQFLASHPEIIKISENSRYRLDNNEPEKPETPVLPKREDFEDDEDFEWAMEEYNDDLERYPEDLAEYEADLIKFEALKTKEIPQGLCIRWNGDIDKKLYPIDEDAVFGKNNDGGKVSGGLSGKAFEEKKKAGKVTESDIQMEAIRLKMATDRKVQILNNEFYTKVQAEINSFQDAFKEDVSLSKNELIGFILAVYRNHSYSINKALASYIKLPTGQHDEHSIATKILSMEHYELTNLHNAMVRYVISKQQYYAIDGDKHLIRTAPLLQVAQEWFPDKLAELDEEHKTKVLNTQGKAENKIAALDKLKEKLAEEPAEQ